MSAFLLHLSTQYALLLESPSPVKLNPDAGLYVAAAVGTAAFFVFLVCGHIVMLHAQTTFGFISASVISVVCFFALLLTRTIWKSEEPFMWAVRAVWAIAIILSIGAVIHAATKLLLLQLPLLDDTAINWELVSALSRIQLAVTYGVFVILTACPIGYTYLYEWHLRRKAERTVNRDETDPTWKR